MDKTKIPKLMLKGISQENGTTFKREIRTLDEVRESGIYLLVGNDVDENKGLPPAEYCNCKQCYFEALLEVSRNSSLNGKTDKETIGQKLTITNSSDGSTNTYCRSWSAQHNSAKWTPWLMSVSGDITIVAPTNDYNERMSVLSTNIAAEKSRAEAAEKQIQNNISAEYSFEYGGVGSVGQLPDNKIRIRSVAIPVNRIGSIKFVYNTAENLTPVVFSGGQYGAWAYIGNKSVKYIPDLKIENSVITFTSDGTFDNIKIAFKHSDDSEISQEELQSSYITGGVHAEIDANEKEIMVLNKSVEALREEAEKSEAIYKKYTRNIKVSSSNLYELSDRHLSLVMPVKSGDVIVQSHSTNGGSYISLLKDIDNIDVNNAAPHFCESYKGIQLVAQPNTKTFVVPEDCTYICVMLINGNDAKWTPIKLTINGIDLYGSLLDSIYQNATTLKEFNNYKGLKYCALGDSITYGYIPRNYEGFPGQLNSYAKLAAQKLGMSFVNYGTSGSTLANVSGRSPMCTRYTNMPDDADVITIMGGTNDVRNGVPLGTMADRTDTTYYGALHVLMQGLYTKYIAGVKTTTGKRKKIIVLTPIKLLDSSKSALENTIENNAKALHNWEEWIKAVKEVAAFYSFPCLDMYNLSGINPHLDRTVKGYDEGYTGNYNPYITDGTHPTQEGAEMMADILVGFLKTLG